MTITVHGVKLFYEKTGKGKPIILLHGNGEDHTIFQELVQLLSDEFTVYTPDSRCHGNSQKTKVLTYQSMAEDMRDFIEQLGLEKPIVYGYSDGGIVGLLLAIQYPDLLSKLIISGANLNPQGMEKSFVLRCKLLYWLTRSKFCRLMAYEPNISPQELSLIRIPVLVLAGEHDVILEEHTRMIAENIPNSILKVIPGENHSSYVVHSGKLYPMIQEFLSEK